jgi:ABC-type uncharacterized transport system auxiliary subunit
MRAMPNIMRTVGILATVWALAGCGATRPSKFYSIDLPVASAPAGKPWPVSLLVGRVTAPHILRDDRIAYRMSPTQIGMYDYHRWSEPPATMMEALLVRRLRAEGRFRSVLALSSNARGEFVLRGRLHQFEEVAAGAGLTARVALEVELFERSSGTAVWSNLYSADEPVSGKEVPAVVEALNRGTQRALEQVTSGINAYFTAHPPK